MRHCSDCGRRLPNAPREDGLGRSFPLCGKCDELLAAQVRIHRGAQEWFEKFCAALDLIAWRDRNVRPASPDEMNQRPRTLVDGSSPAVSFGMTAWTLRNRRNGRD